MQKNGGFYLPNPPRDSRIFPTKNGFANFISNGLFSITPNDGEFLMMTIRSHDQFNTTVYTDNDRYRGIYSGRRVILMNKSDMDENSWEEFDEVSIISEFDQKQVRSDRWSIIEYDIPKGTLLHISQKRMCLYHWTALQIRAIPPTSKSVIVKIRPT